MKKMVIGIFIMNLAALTSCQSLSSKDQQHVTKMANPASQFCLKQGGKLIAKKDKVGNAYSLCHLPTGQQIDEWELFRKSHPHN